LKIKSIALRGLMISTAELENLASKIAGTSDKKGRKSKWEI